MEKPVEIKLISAENIFLPIPNPTEEKQTTIFLAVEIKNNPSLDPLLDLKPELKSTLGSLSSQLVLKDENLASEYQPSEVQEHLRCYLQAKLTWQQRQLELEFSRNREDYSSNSQIIWKIVGLTTGVYQLRFSYTPFPDGEAVTQWVNLHLIEPIESNPRAINANGIIFETIPPQAVVKYPSQPIIHFPYSGQTDFQFGVRITNLTTSSVRFALQNFYPSFLAPDCGLLFIGINRNALRSVDELDLPLVKPDETIELLMNATISEIGSISGYEGYGGVWYLRKAKAQTSYQFKAGTYYLRLGYTNIQPSMEEKFKFLRVDKKLAQADDFWTGSITTPFVKLVIH